MSTNISILGTLQFTPVLTRTSFLMWNKHEHRCLAQMWRLAPPLSAFRFNSSGMLYQMDGVQASFLLPSVPPWSGLTGQGPGLIWISTCPGFSTPASAIERSTRSFFRRFILIFCNTLPNGPLILMFSYQTRNGRKPLPWPIVCRWLVRPKRPILNCFSGGFGVRLSSTRSFGFGLMLALPNWCWFSAACLVGMSPHQCFLGSPHCYYILLQTLRFPIHCRLYCFQFSQVLV